MNDDLSPAIDVASEADGKHPNICFFASGILRNTDLSKTQVKEDAFEGRLALLVASAQAMLYGRDGENIMHLLRFADDVVSQFVSHGKQLRDQHGRLRRLTIDLLDSVSPIDLLTYVAANVDDVEVIVHQANRPPVSVSISAKALCAAFALSQAHLANLYGEREGGFNGMTAAEAWTLARVLPPNEVAIGELIGRKTLFDRGRKGAKARLANDRNHKQAGKAEVRALWECWRRGEMRFASSAAFARHVVDRVPSIVSTKSVERWVTQWNLEARRSNRAS